MDQIACRACGRSYQIDPSYWGRSFACSCGRFVNVPTPPGRPAPDPFAAPVRPADSSGLPVAVFVLGLVGLPGSLFCGFMGVLCVLAWILGHVERRRRRLQNLPPNGLLTAGWILGIIGTALLLIIILVFLAVALATEASS